MNLRALPTRIASSIAAKILLTTGLVMLVLFAVQTILAYRSATEILRVSVAREMDHSARSAAGSIASWFDGRRLALDLTNRSLAAAKGRPEKEAVLARIAVTETFINIYLAGEDGSFFAGRTRAPLPKGYDARVRPWYRRAVAARGPILTEPYPDATNGEIVATLAIPAIENGRITGVAGGDMRLDALAAMLRGLDLEGRGHAFLVDSTGTVLAHTDERLVGRALATIFDGQAPPLSRRFSEVTKGGSERLVRFEPVPGLPVKWYVGVSMDKARVLAVANAGYGANALYTALVMATGLGLLWLLLQRLLLTPLKRTTLGMRGIADGALDTRIGYADRADEIGAIAGAVEIFRANAVRVRELTEEEAQHQAREIALRRRMMADLQQSFGRAVERAVAGDFGGRVTGRFDDPELNSWALAINTLIETIDRGLGETGEVLSALARTDLTKRITGDYLGAFAKLKADTNAVADRFEVVIGELRDTSHLLRASTADLLGGANDLSDRTATQVAAVQGTSSAVRQLSATVAENADRADTASQRAVDAARCAEQSGVAVQGTIAAMNRIRSSSQEIVGIIGLIDEIARQTSLLALNASIEAARAGDAGRGFGVVASEVKSLAARAGQASQSVKRLIDQASADVELGSATVADVTSKLAMMARAIEDSSALIDAIANESRRQAQSVEAIDEAVRAIEAVTRDNVTLADALSVATRDTEARATQLDRTVDLFAIKGRG